MIINEDEQNLLIFIVYHTRKLKIKILENRTTDVILEKLHEIIMELGTPKQICSDNAKEFIAEEFFSCCSDLNFKHHLCSVEKHKSNGCVERVLRTLRDYFCKNERNKIIQRESKEDRANLQQYIS